MKLTQQALFSVSESSHALLIEAIFVYQPQCTKSLTLLGLVLRAPDDNLWRTLIGVAQVSLLVSAFAEALFLIQLLASSPAPFHFEARAEIGRVPVLDLC